MRTTIIASSFQLLLVSTSALAALPMMARAADGGAADAASDPPSQEIVVTAQRLDRARDALLPALGANKYTVDRAALAAQPQGDDRGFQKVLLQTPGVSQDNFGQVHVRNEHGNLQYRLNGIILPEPISGFGQVLDTRIADTVSVITGALPAQYGYRTAGVVDIKTRSGRVDDGGTLSVYGGSYDTVRASGTAQGSTGGLNVFGAFTYGHTGLGIDNPIVARTTYNNDSDTYRGFAYASQILSPTLRLSAVAGLYDGAFGIPAVPGSMPSFVYNGQAQFDSAQIKEHQREKDYYGTLALQYSNGPLNLQVAPFTRLSRTTFSPDMVGDLIFNGFADTARLESDVMGAQADGSLALSKKHTVRFGAYYQSELTHSSVASLVFPVDAMGNQTSDQTLAIATSGRKRGTEVSVYLQDEWQPTSALTVNFGARYDRVSAYTHEDQISPRVNLVYNFTDKDAIHIGYARNFTPPPQELVANTAIALFNGTTKASTVALDDPVLAEREHLFDIGVNLSPLRHVTVSVDSYYKIKRNLIDEGQFGEALVLAPYNYARGYNYGVEVGLNYRHGPLSAYANIAAAEQRANDIVSSQFFFAPDELSYIASHYIYTDHTQKLTGSGGVSYQVNDGLGPLTISGDVIYGSGLRRALVDPVTGDTVVPNGAKLPAYEQVNLGVSQQIKSGLLKGMEIRVDVLNLFDSAYQLRDGTGVGTSAPQFAQRRSVYLGIAKRF